jgi:hypothetical protein
MPSPPRELLVHQKHMTRTLNAHYGVPVDVHVMERHRDGDLYSRKIFLTPRESQPVVEYGLVRLDFRYMPAQRPRHHSPGARAAGLDPDQQQHPPPHSAALVSEIPRRQHDPQLVQLHNGNEDLFGRLGTIYCNGEPAIELVEIVTAVPPQSPQS